MEAKDRVGWKPQRFTGDRATSHSTSTGDFANGAIRDGSVIHDLRRGGPSMDEKSRRRFLILISNRGRLDGSSSVTDQVWNYRHQVWNYRLGAVPGRCACCIGAWGSMPGWAGGSTGGMKSP